MLKLTEKIWIDLDINPDFLAALKECTAALSEDHRRPLSNAKDQNVIYQLIHWCARSTSADLRQADLIANVWVLFQNAAQLLDTIEDGDEIDAPIKRLSQGELVNISTGMIILAQLVLSELENEFQIDAAAANDLRTQFNRHIMQMCGGQHLDLRNHETTLEESWQITEAKSGQFFSLACYAAARVGTDDAEHLNKLKQFGFHIGTIIQIKDDITGLWDENVNQSDLAKSKYSLPVIYALSVLPQNQADLLRKLVENPYPDSAISAARKIIIESGAVLYLSMEIEKRKLIAKSLLTEICRSEEHNACQQLARILDHVSSMEEKAIISKQH